MASQLRSQVVQVFFKQFALERIEVGGVTTRTLTI
eukprot:SAG11_NODE_45995_length_140_cov_2.146341_1_plen_34_part_10